MPGECEVRVPNGREMWVSTRGRRPAGDPEGPREVRTIDPRVNPRVAGDFAAYSLDDVWDWLGSPELLPAPAAGSEYRLLFMDAEAVGGLPEHPRLKLLGYDLSDEHTDRSLLQERGMWLGGLEAVLARANEYGLLGSGDAGLAQALFRDAWPGVARFTIWALFEIVPDAEAAVAAPPRGPGA